MSAVETVERMRRRDLASPRKAVASVARNVVLAVIGVCFLIPLAWLVLA